MTNDEALELLHDFTQTAMRCVEASVWAQAYLTEGGEPTWDAVKGVSRLAASLCQISERVLELEDQFLSILPEGAH